MPNWDRDPEDCPCGSTLGFFAPCPIHPEPPEKVPGDVPDRCFFWCSGIPKLVSTETHPDGKRYENYECSKCKCPTNRRIK